MVRRHPTSELIASKVAEHDVPPHCRAVHPDLLNLARRLRRGFRLLCEHHADQTLHTGWVHRMEDVYQVVFPRNAERLCRAEFRSVDIHPSTANVACRPREALSRLAIATPSKQCEQYAVRTEMVCQRSRYQQEAGKFPQDSLLPSKSSSAAPEIDTFQKVAANSPLAPLGTAHEQQEKSPKPWRRGALCLPFR